MRRPIRFAQRWVAVFAPVVATVLTVGLCGTAMLPFAAAAAAAAATAPQELVVSGQSHVELRNFIGSVQVGEAPGRDYVVRVVGSQAGIAPEVRDGGRVVVVRWPADVATVHSPLAPQIGGWWFKGKVDYDGRRYAIQRGPQDVYADVTVLVPRGARLVVTQQFGQLQANAVRAGLRLETMGGEIVVAGSRGGLAVETGFGRVRVQGHDGEVKAETGSGEVVLDRNTGRQIADTGSGEVRVLGGSGSLKADTGSGDVFVQDFSGDIDADTGSGAVRATGLKAVRILKADTGSGEVQVQGELSGVESLSIDTGSGSVSVVSTGVPSLRLKVDTGSGDISASGAARLEGEEDHRMVVSGAGTHAGTIDTGSGSITVRFGL
jgi:hypothetical protein